MKHSIKWIIIGVVISMLLPVPVTCGAPGMTCTSAPDTQRRIHRNVDVEPLGIALIEGLIQADVPLKYFEYSKVQQLP